MHVVLLTEDVGHLGLADHLEAVVHLVPVGHLEPADHSGLVRAVQDVEPYLQSRELTDRMFMLEALQVRTTESIAHSLEPGQFLTRAELIP